MVFAFIFQEGVVGLAFSCVKMILVAVVGMTAGYAMGVSEGYQQGIGVAQAHMETEALLAKRPSKINRDNLHAMSKNTAPMPAEDDEFVYE